VNMRTLYFSFNGRVGRKQYWINYVLLFSVSITVIMVAITLAAGATQNPMITMLNLPVAVVAVWVALAVTVKRFHDRDKKGWWVLIVLVPVVGSIWLLIENGFLRGTDGPNRFGDDPLEIDDTPATESSPSRSAKQSKSTAVSRADSTAARPGFAATDLLLAAVMLLGALLLAWSARFYL